MVLVSVIALFLAGWCADVASVVVLLLQAKKGKKPTAPATASTNEAKVSSQPPTRDV
jgi:hypothetical protein